ncbi:hypothetical protein D9M68_948920 [compost metagenome]
MSRNAVRLRACTTAITWSHWAGVMSKPVGLWQQACSSTMLPAAAAFSLASMPSKLMPPRPPLALWSK